MNQLLILLIIIYTTIVVSLVWARFNFFRIQSVKSHVSSVIYDPAVAIQIVMTYYFLFTNDLGEIVPVYFGIILYLTGIAFFWWAIVTSKKLDFAFSGKVGEIVTTGPFRLVRHPFYVSYILIWLSSSLLFNSIYLWTTLGYLVAFYLTSAKSEEKVILSSEYSREYQEYSQQVGMFLPRIIQWKR